MFYLIFLAIQKRPFLSMAVMMTTAAMPIFAFCATYDELTTKVPTQAFMWPSSYASWTDVTTAVHALALSVNKQVSIVAKLSNSKRKVYRCSHWIAANKKHFKIVRFVLCYILLPLHTYMYIINDIVVASPLHVGISCGCCTGTGPGRKRIPE